MGGNRLSKSSAKSLSKHLKSKGLPRKQNTLYPEITNNDIITIPEEARSNYVLDPSDVEIDRLQQLHYALRMVWGDNFSAPVEEILNNGRRDVKVLDVGCGAGTWICEMASVYPNVRFFGVDLLSIYPKEVKPSNVTFQRADLLKGLPFPEDTFDYIVMRNLSLAFTVKEWETIVFKELLRVGKPGAYIESIENVWHLDSMGSAFQLFQRALNEDFKSKGIDISIGDRISEIMNSTRGMGNVRVYEKIHPLCKPGGKVAYAFHDACVDGVRSFKKSLLPRLQITSEEYDKAVLRIKRDFEEDRDCEIVLYRYVAQKV